MESQIVLYSDTNMKVEVENDDGTISLFFRHGRSYVRVFIRLEQLESLLDQIVALNAPTKPTEAQ